MDLDDDLLIVAKHLAQEREQSLSRVISDLIRKGLQPVRRASARQGVIPTLSRKPGAQPVTSQKVKQLLEAED